MPPKILVINGPTASGKSALAVRLARELDGEVISADSMQVYAALSIGTARPSEAEMQGVAHHLLGFLPLEESYSVARYVEDASHAAGSIHARGRLPILCGGTGLYLQAFLDNLTFTEQGVDPALRAALKARAQQEGGQALLDELRAFDPETAARLHPNDTGRIVRAIEAFRTTGVPLSEQARRSRAVRTCRASGPGKPSPGVLVARLFRACGLRAACTYRPGFISVRACRSTGAAHVFRDPAPLGKTFANFGDPPAPRSGSVPYAGSAPPCGGPRRSSPACRPARHAAVGNSYSGPLGAV